ncbi:YpbB family protein [Sporosarcina sp. CAU 1771]
MNLSAIILSIICRMDGERSIYSGLHLLRGKRSGQTLQDIEYFNLRNFFGIYPKLNIELYDEAFRELKDSDSLFITEEKIVRLTDKGRALASALPTYHFNGWDYRGNEMIFFSRLSLFVQTVSNIKAGEKLFIPIEKDHDVQVFVKALFRSQSITTPELSRKLFEELRTCIITSNMSEEQKLIVTHRLGGFGLTGWTWNQLAERLKLSVTGVRLLFVESLHMLLSAVEQEDNISLLKKMTDEVKVASYLTTSASQTKYLFNKGMSMEDIARFRRLKMSTIEDHFVEMSFNEIDFPLDQFVSSTDIKEVTNKVEELETKRLRLLKDDFEHLSYFQLRLILGRKAKGEIG